MAKMMTQLELLTKHVIGVPAKVVNAVTSKPYEDDDEEQNLDEEIWYLANYSGGFCPTYQRQGENQGWMD